MIDEEYYYKISNMSLDFNLLFLKLATVGSNHKLKTLGRNKIVI